MPVGSLLLVIYDLNLDEQQWQVSLTQLMLSQNDLFSHGQRALRLPALRHSALRHSAL
jgi:hypothetical protein